MPQGLDPKKTFWIVAAPGNADGTLTLADEVTYAYPTYKAALDKAEADADEAEPMDFYVYRCQPVSVSRRTAVQTTQLVADPHHPFDPTAR